MREAVSIRNMNDETWKKIKLLAVENGMSISGVIQMLMEFYDENISNQG